jgi:hypothetical protein
VRPAPPRRRSLDRRLQEAVRALQTRTKGEPKVTGRKVRDLTPAVQVQRSTLGPVSAPARRKSLAGALRRY